MLEDELVAFGCDFVIATAAAGAAGYESLFDEFGHFSEDQVLWGSGSLGKCVADVTLVAGAWALEVH